MSEYQYYEFAAIDRQLSRAEMAALRAVSARAEITPAGFVDHYEWGDLKADPSDWMRRYFDAFVYTANWCSCRLALRLPLNTLRKTELKPFRTGHAVRIETSDEHWIIDWSLDESENYDRFGMEDGHGWMHRLVPLRDELLRGDLRPLYLGWLAAAARGELDDDALEPVVPPGLSKLSPAQQALAEFLEIDPDMLAAAMAGSVRMPRDDSAQGKALEAERQIRSRHAAWLKARRPALAVGSPQRSVGQLHELARSASTVRVECEAKERTKQDADRRRQREAYLRLLMADVDKRWAAVDTQAQRGCASGYEQAVQALKDLTEAYELTISRKEFDSALRRLLVRHATRGALLRRLTEAGLWSA